MPLRGKDFRPSSELSRNGHPRVMTRTEDRKAPTGPTGTEEAVVVAGDGALRGVVTAAKQHVIARVDVAAGHITPDARTELARSLLALPVVAEARELVVTVPLRDPYLLGSILAGLPGSTARAAGSTCIIRCRR